jgi:hypothetical protein
MALIAFLKFFTNFKSDFRSLIYPFFESKIDFSMVFSNDFVLRKITPYVFSGCSIIFIGYILVNIFTNYPPREIGISP